MAAATEVCNVLVRRVSAIDYRSVIDLFKVGLLASQPKKLTGRSVISSLTY